MKVAILAGGLGTRLMEETQLKPKALTAIGNKPIIWHIMSHYAHYGFKDFMIALGDKGGFIKNHLPKECRADWNVELIDTGEATMTGGRIKRLAPYLGKHTFMLTWCDGLSDINLQDLLAFHRAHGKLATVTAVHPPSRFGHLVLQGNRVTTFAEKPEIEEWINGAFFVLEPGVMEYIQGDMTMWEKEPMEQLAKDSELMAYRHPSFWQCMNTLREKQLLEELWDKGAPWKTWK